MATHRYVGTIGGKTHQIELVPLGEGRWAVRFDGQSHEVDGRRLAGGNMSLLIDHQSYDLELEVAGEQESSGQYNVLVRGQVFSLGVEDERRKKAETGAQLKAHGPQTVKSPMPGKVVKLLVAVGDEVQENQAVVIIEAMKMENEIRSPTAGKVAKIMVEAGQVVEGHAPLLAIE